MKRGLMLMLDNFLRYFNEKVTVLYSNNLYSDFIMQLGGKRYGKGLFNSFSDENVKKWSEIVAEAYPEFRNKFKIFGYDWLGRCFGIDLRKENDGGILLFEIGANDVLEIPCSFEKFLNEEIPMYSDACLAKSFFNEWSVLKKKLSMEGVLVIRFLYF